MTPGSRAPLNPAYFRRIEAMEFAVKYDDGVGRGLDEADVIAFLSERIASYKMPRTVEFSDTPLRDDAGKARRSAVRDEVIARRARARS